MQVAENNLNIYNVLIYRYINDFLILCSITEIRQEVKNHHYVLKRLDPV